MVFKKIEKKKIIPSDPELLFLDLHERDPKIQHLWSHQADLLRGYKQKHVETKDICLELPTGTGKTLVGLLIGEWRRRFFGERVLYLCPTRQLAYQVEEQAEIYGIKACAFLAPQKYYPTNEYSRYNSSDLIAISTYSGLFNTNPRLNNANIIICDDAHAADNYIFSLWSLNITRFSNQSLYHKLIRFFEDCLTHAFFDSIQDDNTEIYLRDEIEMIPIQHVWEKNQGLRDIIMEELKKEENKLLYYPWLMIHDNISICNIFISWWEILIRPWTPPSLTHSPFNIATQRIYMSATLGVSGELERIIGIPKIERLPIPPGWDKKGVGRRFFLFPDFNFVSKDYIPWLIKKINEKERTLILCPDYQYFHLIKNSINNFSENLEILGAKDIENSLDSFTNHNNVILLLTNRYDGLDLPGEDCRQQIIYGLPEAVNLQEKFLLRRLNMYSILKDRIITRMTQACGRCTRSATDFTLILLVGENIRDFCLKRENRLSMLPELQAELEFGRIQSNVSNLEEMDEMIKLFYDQGKEWQEAEEGIKDIRNDIDNYKNPYSEKFYSIVKNEIDFQYSLWNNDFTKALELARSIADMLPGDEFEGYRGLWYYFTGSMALILYENTKEKTYLDIVKDFYARARGCSKTISWFSSLQISAVDVVLDEDMDFLSAFAVEGIQKTIKNLGGVGNRFEREISKIDVLIKNDDHRKFELGLMELGRLLGFKSSRPKGEGAPDSLWFLSDEILLLFEAKSEESEEGGISKRNCLQANGHYNWAKMNVLGYENYKDVLSIIIGHRTKLENSSLPFIDNLFFMDINQVRDIFEEISGILRIVRSHSIRYEEEKVRPKIYEELKNKNLNPLNIIKKFKNKPLSSLDVL